MARSPKNILIITDAFVPPMQGTRMRNLAQNLCKMGYACQLVCEVVDSSVLPEDIPVIPFRYLVSGKSLWSRSINSLLRLTDKLFLLKERRLEHFLQRTVKWSQVDAIIASAYLFPLRSVQRIAQRHSLPLIMDLRDITEQWDSLHYLNFPQDNTLVRAIAKRYIQHTIIERNKALRIAQAVVSVSPWHVNVLRTYNSSTHLIYNGFDEKEFFFQSVKNERFCITYIGKLYDLSLRNPQLLFAALQALVQEGQIPLEEIALRFYVEQKMTSTLTEMAQRYQMAPALQIFPFVHQNQVNDILARSAIVLILNNPSSAAYPIHGVLTTKVYEAIGAEKPLLCIPADHDCLEELVKQTQTGLSSDNIREIQSYILEKYAEWKKNGYTHQKVNKEVKQRFSRQYQAKQFEQILQQTIDTHRSHHTLVDICWTLFYSNTTYDFLHIRGNKFNSLLYKLFGIDLVRRRAIRRFQSLPLDEQQARVERFYTSYLEPRKIAPVWDLIRQTSNIVLVSQTMDLIAKTVAEHIGAQAYYCLEHKEDILTRYADFDIITDNRSDLALIKRARKATIITYNNRSQWERLLPPDLNITYIETGREKY